jgi:predicted DsbA family dithiol-disulfide isomerase
MHFATSSGSDVQCRLAELLFRAYFEEEKDITNRVMLLETSVRIGLGSDEVKRYLESAIGGNEVDAEVVKGQRRWRERCTTFYREWKTAFRWCCRCD